MVIENQQFGIATGVSGDGSSVVGYAYGNSGREVFRWTADEGGLALGIDVPDESRIDEELLRRIRPRISTDGSTIVTEREAGKYAEGVYWTEGGGVVGLGDLPGNQFYSTAADTSEDGSVIVGNSVSEEGFEAIRWTESTGMVGLGTLPGGYVDNQATGVSADGSVVVGFGLSAQLEYEAFRWTEEGGMVGLGVLPGDGFDQSIAHAVSADGQVVIGFSSVTRGPIRSFRWTEEQGMIELAFTNGMQRPVVGFATGLSDDGSVIVGTQLGDSEYSGAFIWDEAHGARYIQDILTNDYGLDLSGWILFGALDVSADGRTIVGYGINPDEELEPWIAVVPEPSTFVLAGSGLFALIACAAGNKVPTSFRLKLFSR